MSGSSRKMRFKLAWQTYRVGDEITPPGTLRDWLLANGYVERVGDAARRPAALAGRAAKKLADAARQLI